MARQRDRACGLLGRLPSWTSSSRRLRRGWPAGPEELGFGLDPALVEMVAEADGGLVVHVDGSTLVVISPDRPGLFCELTGLLCLHGLEVVAADLWSAPGVGDGMAVDMFVFHRIGDSDADWDRFETTSNVRSTEAWHSKPGSRRERASTAPASGASGVRSNRPCRRQRRVRRRVGGRGSGPDAIGVLYRIARALNDMRLDIRHAKVLTLGHEIVDSFYVVDLHGKKLTDPEHVGELERAVLFELFAPHLTLGTVRR